MSKIRKKRIDRVSEISKLDLKFQKIIQFSGWFFLLILGGFMGIWILFDYILSLIQIELTAMTYAFIIFIGTNSAVSFAFAAKLKENNENKQKFFQDWIVGEFLFCLFAIFAVAVYQW